MSSTLVEFSRSTGHGACNFICDVINYRISEWSPFGQLQSDHESNRRRTQRETFPFRRVCASNATPSSRYAVTNLRQTRICAGGKNAFCSHLGNEPRCSKSFGLGQGCFTADATSRRHQKQTDQVKVK
jgi:hypothetical protein